MIMGVNTDMVQVHARSRSAEAKTLPAFNCQVPTFLTKEQLYRYMAARLGHPVLLKSAFCPHTRPSLVTSDNIKEIMWMAECSDGVLPLVFMKVPSLGHADLVNHGAELLNSRDAEGALACLRMADYVPGSSAMEHKRLVLMGRIFLLDAYGMTDLDRAERYFSAAAVVERGSYYVNALFNLGHVNRIRGGREQDAEAKGRLLAAARAYYEKAVGLNGHTPSARWLAKMGEEGF